MMNRRYWIIGLLVVAGVAGLWSPGRAIAQTPTPAPNLLANGSLEGPYYAQGGPTRTVPHGWNLWVGAGAPESLPYNQSVEVLDGSLSWNIKQGGVAFVAAGYQQVTGLTEGETLRATAYGWVFTCNNSQTQCVIESPPYRQSNSTAGASLKVGIDPAGGTDPLAERVRWSAAVAPYDQWSEMSVTAAAQSDTVTVFLFMSQTTGLAINQVFWDDASLQVATGEGPDGGEVPFVVPQGVRPDGSIVHVVQAGDTLWSIAYAYIDYGVTVESIAALNDSIRPTTRYLQLGQEIMILPPGSVDPVTGQVLTGTPSASVTAAPETPTEAVVTAGPTVIAALPTVPATRAPQPTRETQALPSLPAPSATPTGTPEPAATEELSPTATGSPTVTETLPATETPTATPTAPETTATDEATPTPEPTATATTEPTATPIPAPTATPQIVAGLAATTGTICVSVFEDDNLNGVRDSGETVLSGAQISVAEVGGNSESFASGGLNDPFCLDLPTGHYLIDVRLPASFGLSTPESSVVALVSGRHVDVAFGGAKGYTPPPTPEGSESGTTIETLEPGAVAPLIEEPVAAKGSRQSLLDRLYDNSGLIVLAAAGFVVIGGGLALLLLRRPGA